MSIESLITIMDNMLKLHKSLHELTLKKTDIVKKGDTAALDQLLKDEQAHVSAISKLEQERTAVSSAILPTASLEEIAEANPQGENQLLQIKKELVSVIADIKSRNELNQQMIHQSLQFINFSKSLVMPQQKDFNYGPPAGKKAKPGQSSGMFNSKA